MFKNKTVACVIPARLASTRFPRKVLAPLAGKPLLQWVWEAASHIPFFDEVLIAVDSEETAEVIESFGGRWQMTDVGHANGTERMLELFAKKEIDADIWVNWQADEPFVSEEMIGALLTTVDREGIDVWTLCTPLTDPRHIADPSVVKVVKDHRGRALYFSRAPIPFYREACSKKEYYKHCGLYAFSDQALAKIRTLPPSPLEQAEKLEQLRFLEGGLVIHVQQTPFESLGIDLPEHLAAAERRLLGACPCP